MAFGSQGAFAQDVSTYNELQTAINNRVTPIEVTGNLTADRNLGSITGSTARILQSKGSNKYTISGTGTNGTKYSGINVGSTGSLTVNNLTLKDYTTALTNAGTLTVNGVTLSNNTTAIQNTAGTLNLENITIDNTNTNGLNLSGGTTTLAGTNTVNNATMSGNSKLVNQGTTTISGKISSGTSTTATIENNSNLTLSGDNSDFIGSYTQKGGKTTVTNKFFGRKSTIEAGTLEWHTTEDLEESATLEVKSGATLDLGKDDTQAAKLTVRSGSTIAAGSTTNIKGNSTLDVSGGTVNLNNNANWKGNVNLNSGTLNLAGVASNGKLNAQGGNLNLTNNTELTIANGSEIAANVKANIGANTTLNVGTNTDGKKVVINSGDTWAGTINVSGGELEVSGQTSNGKLVATGGKVNLTGGNLTIGENSSIAEAVQTTIGAGSNLNITTGGSVALNNNDTWNGKVAISGGELTVDSVTTGANANFVAAGGQVTLTDTTLNINANSRIDEAAQMTINSNSTININSSSVTLDSQDNWSGTVNLTGGTLNAKGIENTGAFTATRGNLNITENSKITTAQIADAVRTTLANGTSLEVIAGTADQSVTLGSGDTWAGDVTLTGGTLNAGISNTGKLTANGGNLNISNSATIKTAQIAGAVTTDLASGTTLNVIAGEEGQSVTLNSGDKWLGDVNLNGGILNAGTSNTGKLTANTGTLNIQDAATIKTAQIADVVKTNIASGTTLEVIAGTTGQSVTLNEGDDWSGAVNLKGGTLNTSISNTGDFTATSGNLNIQDSAKITTAQINSDVVTNLVSTATLDVVAGTEGQKVVMNGDTWTGTINVIDGELEVSGYNTTNKQNGKLNAAGGKVNLKSGNLTIKDTSVIAKEVETTVGGTMNIQNGGKVVLNDGDTWTGTVDIAGGELTINNIANGTLKATAGNVKLESTTLEINNGSQIGQNVNLNIDSDSIVNINASSVVLNTGDTWSGTVNLKGGELTTSISNETGTFTAESGKLNIQGDATIKTAQIAGDVTTNIASGTTLEVIAGTNQSVTLNTGDTWAGTVHLNGGELTLDSATNNGVLTAETGKLNLDGGRLAIGTTTEGTSSIAAAVQTTIGSATNLDISEGGQVTLDGATNDVWSGRVNISGGNLVIDNIVNGTLVATGGNIDIKDGTVKITGESTIEKADQVTIEAPAVLLLQKDNLVNNIKGAGTLDVDGKKLTFNNNSHLDSTIQFKSENNAFVVINNSTKANDVLEVVKAGTNSGLTIELNASNSSTDLNIDGTSISNLVLKGEQSFGGALTNNGTTSNSGKLALNGNVSGNGTFNNTGNITTSADHSGFSGTYEQTAGSLTVDQNGKVFAGEKNISNSKLDITADNVYYTDVNLGNNGNLIHHGTSTDGVNNINTSVVEFVGQGANATFTNGNYNLSKIDNDKSNTVAITGSTITLEPTSADGTYDYRGGTTYDFTNSILDVLEKGDDVATNDYYFTNLVTDNTTLNFNVNIVNGGNGDDRKIVTDTIHVTNGGAEFKVGKIYISGEENGNRGKYTTDNPVLDGGKFVTNPNKSDILTNIDNNPDVSIATTKWIYDVNLNNAKDSITLNIRDYASNSSLNDMNIDIFDAGTRHFTFSENLDTANGEDVYKITKSLDETAAGTFHVYGNKKGQGTLSGDEKYSFFNIHGDTDVKLNISDIKIEKANGTSGSVVYNESGKAVVKMDNTVVSKNNSTGNGGAIFNGGKPTDNDINNLVISSSTFEKNTAGGNGGAIFNAGNALISGTTFTENSGANGGAIYNEGKMVINGVANTTTFADNKATGKGGAIYNSGDLTLNNVTLAAANGDAKNDIYQETGSLTLQGTNKLNSDITADAGTILNEGNTTVSGNISGKSDITNKGTLTLTGDNSGHTGTFTQESGKTTIEGIFFGGNSTIKDGTLNWHTENDIIAGATLNVLNNSTLNIGSSDTQAAVLSINSGSSIADTATTTIRQASTLNVSGGDVTLNSNDTWKGKVTLSDGKLTVNNVQNGNGKLEASDGELDFKAGNLAIAAGSYINEEVKTTVDTAANLNITGGKVKLDGATSDIWKGAVNVSSGEFTINDIGSNGTINATGGKVTLEAGKLDIANNKSQITEAVETILASGTNTNVNNGGLLELNKGDDWSGAVNVTTGGTFNINNVDHNNTLTADGGTVNLKKGTITLDNTSSITYKTKTTIDGNINIEGAKIELNEDDKWAGDITITSGSLDLKNLNGNGKLIAKDGGSVNLNEGELVIGAGSIIAGNNADGNSTAVTIAEKTTVHIKDGGQVTFNENDTWKGIIHLMEEGTLNIEEKTNGILHADSGYLNFSTGKLTIENGSYIKLDTVINLPGPSDPADPDFPNGSILEIKKGGEVAVNDNDIWNGEIFLNGGILNYGTTQSGTLTADNGDMNLLEGSILNIQIPSQVQDQVNVDIRKGALVNLTKDAEFRLDENDKWNGMINNAGGILTTTNLSNDTGNGGGLQQTAGSSTFQDNSHIYITNKDSYIVGGDLSILNNSSLFLGADTAELKVDNLTMANNSLLDMRNYKINTSKAENMIVNGNNNVSIEISPRDWQHDKFIINNIKSDSKGNIHISDFNFLGECPIDRQLKLRIFNANSIKNVTFDTTDKEIFTPIGWYDLKSVGGGYFTSNLTRYNPQVFRGQVATLAMYNNQLAIDDMLLNHVTLQSERFLAQGKNANRYAINASQFAPYQYRKEDGGLWFKNYVNFETLSMTQNLNVHNTAYGSIIGADLPVKNLKNGWEYMPTAYIGYNGSQQSFNNMHMYQNGGQLGVMNTFMKNDFVGSVLAYAGTYYNEMQVAGYKDEAMNWFVGTAAKAAYNIHATKHFTVQPTAFISYNYFGKQNWGTDFGNMSMNSGMMNGVNIAPGVNFIYARETWNIYATLQYMYNINEGVSGNAGNVQLHDVRMRHGYIQYGIGATKTWKDRLSSYVQLVFRNGGRTGIGVQLGAQYLFDFSKPSKKQNKKQKSTIKTL